MEVKIPFQERWREKMLSGPTMLRGVPKTCTSRTSPYGQPGDTFQAFGATFELLAVRPLTLGVVAMYFAPAEGCASPDAFKEVWIELHPRKGWKPNQLVYVHQFRRLP